MGGHTHTHTLTTHTTHPQTTAKRHSYHYMQVKQSGKLPDLIWCTCDETQLLHNFKNSIWGRPMRSVLSFISLDNPLIATFVDHLLATRLPSFQLCNLELSCHTAKRATFCLIVISQVITMQQNCTQLQ